MEPDPKNPTKSQMHDKCKQVVLYNNHLLKFYKDLKTLCPDFSRDIAKSAKHYKGMDRMNHIKLVLSRLEPHIKSISQYDEAIFSNDYCKEPMRLIPGIDFKKVMKFINDSEDLDQELAAKTKKSIFNHLQSIYISADLASSQINQFNTAMSKQKDMLLNMLKNVNLDERLKERVERITKDEEEAAGSGGGGSDSEELLKKLGEALGEDNFIFTLAKDIAEEINLGNDEFDSPVDAISVLLANNGQKLQELIVSITEKIEERVEGEITPEQLQEQARNMKERLGEVMGDIPELSGLKNPMDITKLFSEQYEKLDKKTQEKYTDIKELLARDMKSWSDDEKKRFDEFSN